MKYKRILIKISGEALADEKNHLILDKNKLEAIAKVVKKLHQAKVQVGIVIGAGNIWRGKLAKSMNIDPATGDYMGMLGTTINCLALGDALNNLGLKTKVLSAVTIETFCEKYSPKLADKYLKQGYVVLFAAGTGKPFFTTDTTASLRALDIGADAIFAAKNGVDGVYDSDPRINKNAKRRFNIKYFINFFHSYILQFIL